MGHVPAGARRIQVRRLPAIADAAAVEWSRTIDLLITNQLFKALIYLDARQGRALMDLDIDDKQNRGGESGVPAENPWRLNTTKVLLMALVPEVGRSRCAEETVLAR